ncbi:MAG TPA: 50S ribosomal protein L24 [archaeon]|nr:50S ribosomal protein L24 [archaeon]
MRNEWSPRWNSSTQPRKQRKYRYNAPLHVRHSFLTAPLSAELRQQLRIRSLPVRKGDEVEVLRGQFARTKGSVDRVDLRKAKVYVSTAKVKKAGGAEVLRPIDPSKVRIVKLGADDKERSAAIKRTGRTSAPVARAKTAPTKVKAEKAASPAVKKEQV